MNNRSVKIERDWDKPKACLMWIAVAWILLLILAGVIGLIIGIIKSKYS